MAEHTPGDWVWLNYPDGRKLLTGPNNAVIHCPGPGPEIRISKEDQDLIAAAPQLLKACEAFAVLYISGDSCGEWTELRSSWDMAKAAIKKAKGRQ